MVPTKKTTKRLAISVILALATLILCVDSCIAALNCQTHTWLHLPVNSTSMCSLIGCYFAAQIFLIVSIVRYHRQSHIPPKAEENWTKDLKELDESPSDFLLNNDLGINLRTLICTEISMYTGNLEHYEERNDMIDIIEKRIKEYSWLTLSDGTTYKQTFDPCK
jgi:hypothetical protein